MSEAEEEAEPAVSQYLDFRERKCQLPAVSSRRRRIVVEFGSFLLLQQQGRGIPTNQPTNNHLYLLPTRYSRRKAHLFSRARHAKYLIYVLRTLCLLSEMHFLFFSLCLSLCFALVRCNHFNFTQKRVFLISRLELTNERTTVIGSTT